MRLRRTGTITKIIIVVLLVYAVVSLVHLADMRAAAQGDLDALRDREAELAAENDDLRYSLEHSDDEEVIRQKARDELGLVDPGEEIYTAG